MTLWCLSGFVMMYQSFPQLSSAQRLAGLQTLDLDSCCTRGALRPHDDTPAGNVRIEMLLGEPVLRLAQAGDAQEVIRLRSGSALPELTEQQVLQVAAQYATGNGIIGVPAALGITEGDQWTLLNARRNTPAWHVALNDQQGTRIYINGRSGEVFQQSNRRERVLSWFGAIPHWIYFSQLRMSPDVWTEVVVWTSVLGSFLTATGLYVGIARARWRRLHRAGTQPAPSRSLSPYRGWWYWHHMAGLVFGVLTLTWVFSGLLTMNPWGWLSGSSPETRRYQSDLGGITRWSDLQQLLGALGGLEAAITQQPQLVQITPQPFLQEAFFLGYSADSASARYDATGNHAPLDFDQIRDGVTRLGVPLIDVALLSTEDSYYYGHKRTVELPVVRVLTADADSTRLYINPQTGQLRTIGSTGRLSRWVRTGLHDLDFPVIRQRPWWDIVVIILLSGVTAVCITGTWMALRRVRRDLRSGLRRRPSSPGSRNTRPQCNPEQEYPT
jgi:uncharacterized iron-regulated membrane protein